MDKPKAETDTDIWWHSHDNMVTLTRFMAHTYDAMDVAYAVEKPWKFHDVWLEAQEDQANG